MNALARRRRTALPVSLALFAFFVILPQPSEAIPAFARKYAVKCYNCHLIPPVLNKTGYMFKRLGYRMPPDEMDGTKPAPFIGELDKGVRWSITNSLALITQGSFTVEKIKGDNPSSTSAFNLDKAILFAGGSVPDTGFSYFAEYKFYEGGEASTLEQAMVDYTWGRANSSVFAKAGQMHVQEGEGTRAAMMFSLFDEAPLTLGYTSPIDFTLDQHPVGIEAGYTWASPFFKHIFGISGKVTNGVNPDGSEILTATPGMKNYKDFWLNADYWFGPDGGVTFMTYQGKKQQIQNQGTPDEFTFAPRIRRYGLFANYLFFDKVDLLGGYLRGSDEWQAAAEEPLGKFTSDAFHLEADYYIRRGFALMARYDRVNQKLTGLTDTHANAWGVGGAKALTDLGNAILRISYTHEHAVDPVSASATSDNLFKIDLRFMW